jgi:hypothetical protein
MKYLILLIGVVVSFDVPCKNAGCPICAYLDSDGVCHCTD